VKFHCTEIIELKMIKYLCFGPFVFLQTSILKQVNNIEVLKVDYFINKPSFYMVYIFNKYIKYDYIVLFKESYGMLKIRFRGKGNCFYQSTIELQ